MKDFAKDVCRVAVVQESPVLFDKEATTKKAVQLIEEAGKQKADLIVFPESFIPCYPYGMTFGFTVSARTNDGRLDWKRYYDHSVVVPGEETKLLGEAAKKANAYVSIGITERDALNATLYCKNILTHPNIIALIREQKEKTHLFY